MYKSNKTNEEKLYMELIHFTRGARRYLHGEGARPEGPTFHFGPGCPPGEGFRGPHGAPDRLHSAMDSPDGPHCAPDRPDGPPPEFPPDFHCGRPHRPHGHRSPVLSRERILIFLLDHETAQAEEKTTSENTPAHAAPGLRQKQLTEIMRVNASSMSEFIGHLESDGYVERNVDPSDKRATLISLTEKGRARACELQDERKEKMDRLFSPLTEEEKKELFRLLDKLQRRGEE